MKKITMLIISIIISTTQFAYSQIPEPCVPDCPNTPFGPTKVMRVHLQNTCWTNVYYSTRIACGIWQDIQIIYLEPAHKRWGHNHLLYVASLEEEFKRAMAAIIKLNPMGFDPQVDSVGCNSTWRISNKSCWASFETVIIDVVSGLPVDTLLTSVPCSDSDCCLTPTKVCRDANNNISIENLGSVQNVNCSQYTFINGSELIPCFGICDWVPYDPEWISNLISEEYPPVDLGQASLLKKANQMDYLQFGINTFNYQDKISFQMHLININELTIEFYDIKGRQIYSEAINVVDGINEKDIYYKNLQSGLVIYSIKNGNRLLNTGKLIIK